MMSRGSWTVVATGVVLAAIGGAVLKRATTRVTPVVGEISAGEELVFVFVTSSSCPGTKDPRLPGALSRARDGLASQAERDGQRFVTIGVAMDWSIPSGKRMLDRFGPFDEIVVGRGWLNTGVIKYIWEDIRGIGATPQVVVTERSIAWAGNRTIEVDYERLVVRKTGPDQIEEWSRLAFGDARRDRP